MARRPTLVLAMDPDIVDLVIPAPLRARLAALTDVHPETVTDWAGCQALADADILFTGWGCPVLDAAVLDRAPRLAAVVHAAGTVKHHVRPEVWERGIAVSSAADANAAPVVEFTLATVWLAARRALSAGAGYARGTVPTHAQRHGADGATARLGPETLMNVLWRWLARQLGIGKRQPFASPGLPAEKGHPRPRSGADALVSPWRIYRIYAHLPHLLLRNEKGKVVDIGVVQGATPDLSYQLSIGNSSGKGFETLALLLADVSGQMQNTQIESEFLRLPDCEAFKSVDLDRTEHVDVSLAVEE